MQLSRDKVIMLSANLTSAHGFDSVAPGERFSLIIAGSKDSSCARR